MYAWLVDHQRDENNLPPHLGGLVEFDNTLNEPIVGITREDNELRAEQEGASFAALMGRVGALPT